MFKKTGTITVNKRELIKSLKSDHEQFKKALIAQLNRSLRHITVKIRKDIVKETKLKNRSVNKYLFFNWASKYNFTASVQKKYGKEISYLSYKHEVRMERSKKTNPVYPNRTYPHLYVKRTADKRLTLIRGAFIIKAKNGNFIVVEKVQRLFNFRRTQRKRYFWTKNKNARSAHYQFNVLKDKADIIGDVIYKNSSQYQSLAQKHFNQNFKRYSKYLSNVSFT